MLSLATPLTAASEEADTSVRMLAFLHQLLHTMGYSRTPFSVTIGITVPCIYTLAI